MIPNKPTTTWLAGAFAAAALAAAGGPSPARAAEAVSFTLDVLPILQSRCASCHSAKGEGYEVSGLDLTTYEGLMKGTKYGPIVVPGDSLTSNLAVLIEGRAMVQMPHDQRPLLKCQQDIISTWVKQGALNN
ncbi:MAG: c-type cytochrome domain-containing protein [Rhodospirillales bacterium]